MVRHIPIDWNSEPQQLPRSPRGFPDWFRFGGQSSASCSYRAGGTGTCPTSLGPLPCTCQKRASDACCRSASDRGVASGQRRARAGGCPPEAAIQGQRPLVPAMLLQRLREMPASGPATARAGTWPRDPSTAKERRVHAADPAIGFVPERSGDRRARRRSGAPRSPSSERPRKLWAAGAYQRDRAARLGSCLSVGAGGSDPARASRLV